MRLEPLTIGLVGLAALAIAAEDIPPSTVLAPPHTLMVADFDAADRITNFGSEFGVWSSGQPSPTGKSSERIDPVGGVSGSGGWRVEYDIGNDGSFSGTWLKLQGFDATAYKSLVLLVKSESSQPMDFILELKQGSEGALTTRRYVVREIGPEWKRVEIPLAAFRLPSMDSLYELTTVFDNRTTKIKKGGITIDEIQFIAD